MSSIFSAMLIINRIANYPISCIFNLSTIAIIINLKNSLITKSEMKIKNLGVLIKTINIVTGIGLVVLGILSILNIFNYVTFQIFLIPCPFFISAFGFALLGAEFKIKAVVKRMWFLQSLTGRGIFNIFLSSLTFWFFITYSQIISWVSALILFITGIVYIVVDCGYGKELKKQIEDEEKKNRRKANTSTDEEKVRENLI